MALNYTDALIFRIFFSSKYYSTNTTVLHPPDSLNPWIQRADCNCNLYVDFGLQGGPGPLIPVLFKGQLHT